MSLKLFTANRDRDPAIHTVTGKTYVVVDWGSASFEVESGGVSQSEAVTATTGFAEYTVQVGAFRDHDTALRITGELEAGWPGWTVRHIRATNGEGESITRLFLGSFENREKAVEMTGQLSAFGFDGTFPVRHQTMGNIGSEFPGSAGDEILAVYNEQTGLIRNMVRLEIRRCAGDNETSIPLLVNGKPYRGAISVYAAENNLVAVNHIDLESYLKGVVPCEMGPEAFPLLEALKAQAVAARTYAAKHLARHRAEGFDLCDEPHCQVYGGASREHPLSSRAVDETADLVAVHGPGLAETLYTSTCGGHTEKSSFVFTGEAPPYLQGVPCGAETAREILLIPQQVVRPVDAMFKREDGTDISFSKTLLEMIDVLERGERIGPQEVNEDMDPGVTRCWIERTASFLHAGLAVCEEQPESSSDGNRPSLSGLARSVCLLFGWNERVQALMTREDAVRLVGDEAESCRNEADLRASAYLLASGVIKPLPGGKIGFDVKPSCGRMMDILARIVLLVDPSLFNDGYLQGCEQGALLIRTGSETSPIQAAPEGVSFFQDRWGKIRSVQNPTFMGGDRIGYHLNRLGEVDLMIHYPAPTSTAADRYSPYAFWSVSRSREEIESALLEREKPVGEVFDLVPQERGPANRIRRLVVRGSDGKRELRGLEIRWTLGIRENFFYIDRVRDHKGKIMRFLFTGRGWGHGVGMCQVGAAGLAETGSDFVAILGNYYPGIQIQPLTVFLNDGKATDFSR